MRGKVETAASPRPVGAYSQGIVAGPFVYVSGQGPFDATTGRIPEGIAAQTHQVLRNIRSILEAAGSSLQDVVKVNAHLADLADFSTFDVVYRDYFDGPYPARTTVGSQLMGIRVEVDVIAERVDREGRESRR